MNVQFNQRDEGSLAEPFPESRGLQIVAPAPCPLGGGANLGGGDALAQTREQRSENLASFAGVSVDGDTSRRSLGANASLRRHDRYAALRLVVRPGRFNSGTPATKPEQGERNRRMAGAQATSDFPEFA